MPTFLILLIEKGGYFKALIRKDALAVTKLEKQRTVRSTESGMTLM